jgi:cell wall assembly regulator SMI1
MSTVKASWKRIAGWLHDNLPEDRIALAGSADAKLLSAFEKRFRVPLPADVKESYRTFNGSGGFSIFPYGYRLLSLEDSAQTCSMWRDLLERGDMKKLRASPQGPIKGDWWNAKWFPFASSGSDDFFCVDTDPAPGGSVGQIIEFSHEEGPMRVLGGNLGEWLESYADELDEGAYMWDADSFWIVPTSGSDGLK